MSLDVSLIENKETVFSTNITNNLVSMAIACGVYNACWYPDHINCKKAKHILPTLKLGLHNLKAQPEYHKKFTPLNRCGDYEDFIFWLEDYSKACEKYPEAKINVSR